MSLQSILDLTHPTKSDALKTQVAKSLKTMAEAVYAEGMVILDDNEDLEEEKVMWTMQWEHALVHGCTIQICW